MKVDFKQSFENWKQSSFVNKVGTSCWALATVLMFLGMILGPIAGVEEYSGMCFGICFPFFVINIIITFFLFLDVDVVKVIAKNVGYYFIICVVLSLLALLIFIPIFLIVIKAAIPALSNMGEMLVSLVEKIDPGTIINTIGNELGDAVFRVVLAVFPFVAMVLSLILVIVASFMLPSSDRPKNKVCALLMLLLFGLLGGHLSYAKRRGAMVVRIILSISIIGLFVSELLCFIDLILILIGKFKDGQKNYVTDWV